LEVVEDSAPYIPQCCPKQLSCRLLGMSCTSSIQPDIPLFWRRENHIKEKHFWHDSNRKVKECWQRNCSSQIFSLCSQSDAILQRQMCQLLSDYVEK
jgi:hypothetical protein